MGSKHCNTDGRSVRTTRATILKNKPHLVTFHENIWIFWSAYDPFQPNLVNNSSCSLLHTMYECLTVLMWTSQLLTQMIHFWWAANRRMVYHCATNFPNNTLVTLPMLKSAPLFIYSWQEKWCMHTFLKSINRNVRCTTLFRIWTRVVKSICYNDSS